MCFHAAICSKGLVLVDWVGRSLRSNPHHRMRKMNKILRSCSRTNVTSFILHVVTLWIKEDVAGFGAGVNVNVRSIEACQELVRILQLIQLPSYFSLWLLLFEVDGLLLVKSWKERLLVILSTTILDAHELVTLVGVKLGLKLVGIGAIALVDAATVVHWLRKYLISLLKLACSSFVMVTLVSLFCMMMFLISIWIFPMCGEYLLCRNVLVSSLFTASMFAPSWWLLARVILILLTISRKIFEIYNVSKT